MTSPLYPRLCMDKGSPHTPCGGAGPCRVLWGRQQHTHGLWAGAWEPGSPPATSSKARPRRLSQEDISGRFQAQYVLLSLGALPYPLPFQTVQSRGLSCLHPPPSLPFLVGRRAGKIPGEQETRPLRQSFLTFILFSSLTHYTVHMHY